MAQRYVELNGLVVGNIWMPNAECWKNVSIGENDFRYSDGSRPTLRDMAERATNDGDFQSCNLTADSEFIFTRERVTSSGVVVRRRRMHVSQFPSVRDMVDARESWEIETADVDDE